MGAGRYHRAVKIVPAGDNAVLIELGDVSAAELHARANEYRAQPGVLAVIPGHSSLYVIRNVILSPAEDEGSPGRARNPASARDRSPSTGLGMTRRTHRIRVNFDGPDLPPGYKPRPMTLTVRYLGFRGGFGYLDGWPEEWAMPRRPTSRPVRRGSFAVAGSVAGFYPIDSPGGWNILGHTDYDLFHALTPGDTIEVEPSDEALSLPPLHAAPPASLHTRVIPPDWSRLARGLSPGGPFDDVAAAMLDAEEVIECAMVWPKIEGVWVGPDLRTGNRVPSGKIEGGLRGYVVERTTGVSPAPAGHPARPYTARRDAGRKAGETPALRGDRHVIQAIRGPHDIGLDRIECEVTPQLDRVGIRLRPLQRIEAEIPADLKSIGMQCGTVQLHPDGSLVAMGPDHPVTGGYLQPMTVITTERWKLAQLSPGERVTLFAV